MATEIPLKSVSAAERPCKICGCAARLFGHVDFNRSCEEKRSQILPALGIPVHYHRCVSCSFLFTECFDDWSEADFKQFIYNEDYIRVDPDYLEARPATNARYMITKFYQDRSKIRILDFGGGNGRLAHRLLAAGFTNVETYDPFTPQFSVLPDSKFDLITSFETFEHLPDPHSALDTVVKLLAPNGAVLFSTLVQPPAFEDIGMSWWYIGPRNGHVSLFSDRALAVAWQRHRFKVASFSPGVHLAFQDDL